MISAQRTPVLDNPPPETGDPSEQASAPASTSPDATALREAMLDAIGELSEEERAELGSVEHPADVATVWRDLIAERAAQEREATVRAELTREFEVRSRGARPRPTAGLRGGAPPAPPASVAEWTDFIHSSGDEGQRQQRRARFADWLANHPDA